ncbi:MAG: hypothetical protein A2042_05735 [Candidatus Schekmanbacteria bacterium GWA2_38_11]|uniref:DUF2269 domain-containing protein n=1 Tax=Candidatus Schekmanbacteria bacterium GWA2_38_11 TaxID=1817876 RepID=A0A1F7RI99_9BACT|nr:MAG: hypothetical protein A2042_05735 [Candidatus Schekmanbacteria bacterium GWA2_38_11]
MVDIKETININKEVKILDPEKSVCDHSRIEQGMPENVHEAFRHYRQMAIAMSVSLMGLSFTVLGWLLIAKVILSPWYVHVITIVALVLVIVCGATVQFFAFQGYKYQARSMVEKDAIKKQQLRDKANQWFTRQDEIAWILYISFVIAVFAAFFGLIF